MTDHHYHYEYAEARHDHRGEYADQRHDHDLEYAERHHRHYDDESTARGLREDLGRAEERIRKVEDGLRDALERIRALEDRQPDYSDPEADDEDRDDEPEPSEYRCAETSDGRHTAAWYEGGRCVACGLPGPSLRRIRPEPDYRCPDCGRASCTGADCYWADEAAIARPENYERGQS